METNREINLQNKNQIGYLDLDLSEADKVKTNFLFQLNPCCANSFFLLAVFGLNCYQCDSNDNPDCTEYFDHDHTSTLTVRSTECSVDASEYCIKTTGVWGGKRQETHRLLVSHCQVASVMRWHLGGGGSA